MEYWQTLQEYRSSNSQMRRGTLRSSNTQLELKASHDSVGMPVPLVDFTLLYIADRSTEISRRAIFSFSWTDGGRSSFMSEFHRHQKV
jgi:hypothetical protein